MKLAGLKDRIPIGSVPAKSSMDSIPKADQAKCIVQSEYGSDCFEQFVSTTKVLTVFNAMPGNEQIENRPLSGNLPINCSLKSPPKPAPNRIEGQLAPANANGPTNVRGTDPLKVRWSYCSLRT